MSDRILVLGLGGIGDLCQSLQVSWYIQRKIGKENVDIVVCARPETWEVIDYLFNKEGRFNVSCHPLGEKIGENYELITNPELLKEYKDIYGKIYIICPDLLYRANEYSFDWWNYDCHPQILRQKRLLEHRWKPIKLIYCSLNTSTFGYFYDNSVDLVVGLANALPNYQIYCPILKSWAGTEINWPLLPKVLPNNLVIPYENSFIYNISVLEKACYCVTLDGGPMHIAHQFSIPRLILDPRFGYSRNTILWQARWRQEGQYESIDLNNKVEDIVKLVKTNLQIPETTLLPRNVILKNLHEDWSRELLFKFSNK